MRMNTSEIKTDIKKEKEWKTGKKLKKLRDRKTKQPENKTMTKLFLEETGVPCVLQ